MTVRFHARLALLAAACAASALAASADYYPPPDSAGGWRALHDPAQIRKRTGIDVKRLDQAFEYVKRSSQHGGLLVVRHGWLVYENYFGRCHRDATPAVASVSKTFTSLACGIMLEDKREAIPEGLETKVFTDRFLPAALPLSDPRKADIKLGHLLAMSSGMYDSNGGTGIVNGEDLKLESVAMDRSIGPDLLALRQPMWASPGGGYFYSNQGTNILSMLVHRITGMKMEDYLRQKLADPMQLGPWGYVPPRADAVPPSQETPGAAGVAIRSTDLLRYAYMILHHGRWGSRQLVPAGYIELCAKPSPYNTHSPYSLQFTVNADGSVAGAPRDAFFKSGAGGFGIYIVPSLDMVIWKIAGGDRQYEWSPAGLASSFKYDGSRDRWQPHPSDQFHDAPIDVDTGAPDARYGGGGGSRVRADGKRQPAEARFRFDIRLWFRSPGGIGWPAAPEES
jgi:CubicO group peptidase (beta-lactamase class C family)